jgi:type IV pilus assembly protein PilB
VDGVLQDSLTLPKHVHSAIVSRIKILSNLKIDESRLPQDGRFHFSSGQKSVDLRVSILPLIYGEKVVMRLLDKSSSVPTLEQLGLHESSLETVKQNTRKSHGIFLITGPTGSGKSTTLYSILSILNTDQVNIVTMEDPVEYFIPGVNQSQINPDIGLTFASGLRSILRQDPNIVMVGEIRDKETAELAVHAALTGHLVFSTLHTNNAVGAIPRLVDMDIENFLLAASVNMVVAQRLVRKICVKCKEAVEFPEAIASIIRSDIASLPKNILAEFDQTKLVGYRGKGCEFCGNTGYKGRLGIFEVLNITPLIKDMIIEKAPTSEIVKQAQLDGMIAIRQDGIIKVLRGETTYEEVVRVTSE